MTPAPGRWERIERRAHHAPVAVRALLAAGAIATVLALGLFATRAAPDPLPEPPADADAGVDYAAEPDDSVEAGSVAVGYGLSGRAGRTPGRSRTLRFHGDSIEAGVRDGEIDDTGGAVSARGHGRVLRIGRIAPSWGRGLLVGAPADPWVVHAAARAAADPFAPRARAGDGVACAWPGRALATFAGRLGGHEAAGMSWAPGGAHVAAMSVRAQAASFSAGLERDDRAVEVALDPHGRVRAEGVARREAGVLAVAIRGGVGHPAFHSPLAGPRRVPARTATLAVHAASGPVETQATVAGWRYMRGVAGARAGIETRWRDAAGGAVAVGFEEQHGAWRAPAEVVPRATPTRQGAWVEWRGVSPGGTLSVRDEWWGRRAFARGRVREALSVSLESPLPAGAALLVAHTVYRARSGETVYLPERDGDHWVLRALSGAGDRMRATLRIPLAEGTLAGTTTLARAHGALKQQWTLQWSRRIRLRRTG